MEGAALPLAAGGVVGGVGVEGERLGRLFAVEGPDEGLDEYLGQADEAAVPDAVPRTVPSGAGGEGPPAWSP